MKSRKLALFIFSLMIIPNVGCQCWYNVRDSFYYCEPIDEAIHSYNCHRAAKRAWGSRFDRYCERERVDDFGAGFRAGYADVAMGGTGCPPPLPPRRYWGWRYQNCEGQQCVAGWFDGYPAGARAAEEDGVANWSRMQTSYLIDAQYAARMPGAKQGGPLPPVGAFPGEEMLEEIVPTPNASPVATPETNTPAPFEAPTGSFVPQSDASEEFGVLRDLNKPTPVAVKVANKPKIVNLPKIVPVRTPAKAVTTPTEIAPLSVEASQEMDSTEPQELPPVQHLETVESRKQSSPAVVRKFEMPVVEMLNGVSVPKKLNAQAAEASEMEIADSAPEVISDDEPAAKLPPIISGPASAPVVHRAKPISSAPTAGIVEETPGYSLERIGESSEGVAIPAKSTNSTKRTLPPIIPSQPKKQALPIVRPVEESGRLTKAETTPPTKQVSYESDEDEEFQGLRRIGKSN